MKKCTDLILLTVGNIFCAVAVGMVALPLSISLGGTSGLGRILNALIPIRLSVWVMILNVILFSFAYFMVGKKFASKTLFSALV
ncbi:MAG: YitT family protein, partial [Bulleidia sp.]